VGDWSEAPQGGTVGPLRTFSIQSFDQLFFVSVQDILKAFSRRQQIEWQLWIGIHLYFSFAIFDRKIGAWRRDAISSS
jgi:hypothetical protein